MQCVSNDVNKVQLLFWSLCFTRDIFLIKLISENLKFVSCLHRSSGSITSVFFYSFSFFSCFCLCLDMWSTAWCFWNHKPRLYGVSPWRSHSEGFHSCQTSRQFHLEAWHANMCGKQSDFLAATVALMLAVMMLFFSWGMITHRVQQSTLNLLAPLFFTLSPEKERDSWNSALENITTYWLCAVDLNVILGTHNCFKLRSLYLQVKL